MKKILLSIILSLTLFFQTTSVAIADSQSEIMQRVNSDTTVADNLFTEIKTVQDDPEAILKVLLRDIPSVVAHWSESSAIYESKIATETDEELKGILTNINNDIKGLINSLLLVQESIKSGDKETYESSFDQYDSHMASFGTHIESLNNHFGLVDYSWLAWPFWIALIISVVLFIMSRGNPILPAEQLRNQFEFALFKSSLWPLGGSAISYFWYLLTPAGGTFTVFYGLIGVGYFQFFRGLNTYLTEARPAINIAKKEEKEKLEALIRSDKLQKVSMEEKVREIDKKAGVINLSGDKPDKQARG
jgi:hypothetical protein